MLILEASYSKHSVEQKLFSPLASFEQSERYSRPQFQPQVYDGDVVTFPLLYQVEQSKLNWCCSCQLQ